MSAAPSALILGAGVFGLGAALELRFRGWSVTVLNAGPVPHPDAASTDLSKVVRMDYGADAQYTAMGELAIERWREWNRRWGREVFHEDGFLVLSRGPLRSGSFEQTSFDFLRSRGHRLEPIDASVLRRRHPQWNPDLHADGYFNPQGGWAESAIAMRCLRDEATAAGIVIHEDAAFASLIEGSGRVTGVRDRYGRPWSADVVVSALGAWTGAAFPHLAGVLRAIAQPVLHFRPADPAPFRAPAFPVWAADIGNTGWYGFPANGDGIVKVANHGPGAEVDPEGERVLPADAEPRFRAFLREALPALAGAPLAASRVCLYGDSNDGDFLVAPDPARPGLVVAAGDSGHAFKFAPVLGGLIADAVEGKPHPWLPRFAWRLAAGSGGEGARARGE